jgi:hypothetical protein
MKTVAFGLLCLASLLCFTGCANYETRSYEITVKNESSKPIVLWLTKNGPAYEDGWLSPEDLALKTKTTDEPYGFQTVPPGKTAFTDKSKATGHFASGVSAIMRIYVGQLTLNQILAISHGQPDRLEIPLTPGSNSFVVKDLGPTVTVEKH